MADTPKYKQLAKQLAQHAARQQQLEDELDAVEKNIYRQESVYLSGTGSIVRGFDTYTQSSSAAAAAAGNAPSAAAVPVDDPNRVFSLSSATFVKQLQLQHQQGSGTSSTKWSTCRFFTVSSSFFFFYFYLS